MKTEENVNTSASSSTTEEKMDSCELEGVGLKTFLGLTVPNQC